MTIQPTATIIASKDQVSTTTGDEVIILGLADGMYYGLNDVGRSVWDLLKEQTTPLDICSKIADIYDVESSVCQNDVMSLLGHLYERHLIRVEDAGITKT